MSAERVNFDILLRPEVSVVESGVASLDSLKPAQENIVRCQRWFSAHGVEAHATEFGLACRAPKEVFEMLFSVILEPTDGGAGQPALEMRNVPSPPEDIADFVDQISLAVAPELF